MELGADVQFTRDIFKISKSNQQPVYPDLTDFGSLDTRSLRPAVKEKLNNFCKSFSQIEHSGADSYFSRKYIFNYVFFKNDLENGWKNNFGIEYPQKAAESDKIEKSEETALFTKWIIGEPFISSEIMQIPVRFYATCGIIDITVYLNSSGNNEFYQITIDRWKKV